MLQVKQLEIFKKYMNLISDLESELAYAVLIEKKHADKIGSKDILPLIERLNDALASVSSKDETEKNAARAAKQGSELSH